MKNKDKEIFETDRNHQNMQDEREKILKQAIFNINMKISKKNNIFFSYNLKFL